MYHCIHTFISILSLSICLVFKKPGFQKSWYTSKYHSCTSKTPKWNEIFLEFVSNNHTIYIHRPQQLYFVHTYVHTCIHSYYALNMMFIWAFIITFTFLFICTICNYLWCYLYKFLNHIIMCLVSRYYFPKQVDIF